MNYELILTSIEDSIQVAFAEFYKKQFSTRKKLRLPISLPFVINTYNSIEEAQPLHDTLISEFNPNLTLMISGIQKNIPIATLVVLNRNRKLEVCTLFENGKVDIKSDYFILDIQQHNFRVENLVKLSPKELYFFNCGYLSIDLDFIYEADLRNFEEIVEFL